MLKKLAAKAEANTGVNHGKSGKPRSCLGRMRYGDLLIPLVFYNFKSKHLLYTTTDIAV